MRFKTIEQIKFVDMKAEAQKITDEFCFELVEFTHKYTYFIIEVEFTGCRVTRKFECSRRTYPENVLDTVRQMCSHMTNELERYGKIYLELQEVKKKKLP